MCRISDNSNFNFDDHVNDIALRSMKLTINFRSQLSYFLCRYPISNSYSIIFLARNRTWLHFTLRLFVTIQPTWFKLNPYFISAWHSLTFTLASITDNESDESDESDNKNAQSRHHGNHRILSCAFFLEPRECHQLSV